MQSSHTDLLSKKFSEDQLLKPSEEEVAAKADETREALEALLQVCGPWRYNREPQAFARV